MMPQVTRQNGSDLRADLRRFCETANPHQALLSERKLARQYGVSHSTVRRHLHELVQDGLVYKQHGRGSFVSPRAKPASGKNGTILFLNIWPESADRYLHRFVNGLASQAEAFGLDMEILHDVGRGRRAELLLEQVRSGRLGGLIVPFLESTVMQELQHLQPGLPIITTNNRFPKPGLAAVRIDYAYMGWLAVQVAHQQGCGELAIVCRVPDAEREAREAARALDIDLILQADSDAIKPHHLARQLCELDTPAVFFDDDVRARDVLHCCLALDDTFCDKHCVISHTNYLGGDLPEQLFRLELDSYELGRTMATTVHGIRRGDLPRSLDIRLRPVLHSPTKGEQ